MRILSSEGKSKKRKGCTYTCGVSSSMSSLGGGVGAREGSVDAASEDEGVESVVALFAAREAVGLDLRGFAMIEKLRREDVYVGTVVATARRICEGTGP